MITKYTQLTNKYLKANPRRTILTVIGIILSVALISTIGFFFKGLQDTEVQNIKDNYGSFHLAYFKPTPELVSKVQNNPKVLRTGLYKEGEKFLLSDKLQITEIITTDSALELAPYRIAKGRYPAALKEAAVEKWVLRYIDPTAKIGDTIHLQNREFILVGLLEDQFGSQMNNKATLMTKDNDIALEKAIFLVEITPKTNLRKAVDELKLLSDKDAVAENGYLLEILGAGGEGGNFQGVQIAVGIIIAIVVIATIAVIYNSFQIGVVERVKQFGLLRTIGSTPKQIRKIVLGEASVLALICIPLGMLLGVIAVYAISFISGYLVDEMVIDLTAAITPKIIFISIGVSLFSIYASAFIPALFAGRISPLVAISTRAMINKEKIKKRKSSFISKLFGFEGELAHKNIRRNPKRYRVTVFSIIISVVLFVTFSSFLDMVLVLNDNHNESEKVHFSIIRDNKLNDKITIDNSVIEKVKSLNFVQKVYQLYAFESFSAIMSRQNEIPEIQKMNFAYQPITWQGEERTLMAAYLIPYDRESLQAANNYIEAGSINIDRLNRENGVILIKKNRVYNKVTKRMYHGPVARVSVGDEITLQSASNSEVKKVKVLAIVAEEPFNFTGPEDGLKLITTEELAVRLSEKDQIQPIELDVLIDDVKNEDIAKVEIKKVIERHTALKQVNLIDSNRRQRSAILLIQILLYGFVVVVSCIGSVNIINTITTNIILRKRELAMLKSIGMTQKSLKKMIVLEGMLYGIMGTIYGSIIATGLSYLIYRGMMNTRESLWSIPWLAMAIAGAAALLIGYISVLTPLARIKKDNLIDVVREDY